MALQTSRKRRSSFWRARARAPGSCLQRLVGVEVGDGVLEAVSLDEPHGIEGSAVVVGSEAVDGDDPGMFEAAGDLGFEQEAGSLAGVVGVAVLDLLEGDLATQLLVVGDVDDAEAALGVVADLAVAGGDGDVIGRRRGLGWRGGSSCGSVEMWAIEARTSGSAIDWRRASAVDSTELRAARLATGSPPCLATWAVNHRLQQGPDHGVEGASLDEDLAEGPVLLQGPGVHRGDQGVSRDEVHLEREDAEQEVAVGVTAKHETAPWMTQAMS